MRQNFSGLVKRQTPSARSFQIVAEQIIDPSDSRPVAAKPDKGEGNPQDRLVKNSRQGKRGHEAGSGNSVRIRACLLRHPHTFCAKFQSCPLPKGSFQERLFYAARCVSKGSRYIAAYAGQPAFQYGFKNRWSDGKHSPTALFLYRSPEQDGGSPCPASRPR